MKTIEQKVIKFVDYYKLISPNEKILIALSGGPDSVFALHFLIKFQRRFKIFLGAAHINHSLRGKNSDKDEEFCKDICEKLKIDFYSTRVNVKSYSLKNKLSVEEAARDLRYSALNDILKKFRYDKIVTAHTIDDNAETVLLNLFKGAGLKGISGIPVIRGNIIRPLLILGKDEILEYLDKTDIAYRNDESNKNLEYKRNLIRLKIIPLIKKEINPSFERNLLNSSQLFRNTQVIISDYVKLIIKDVVLISKEDVSIDLQLISRYPIEVLGEILKSVLYENFGHEFVFNDLTKIESLIKNRVGKSISLSGKFFAIRERDKIIFTLKRNSVNFRPIEIKIGEKKKIDNKSLEILLTEIKEIKFDKDKLHEFISADELEDKFVVRRWKAGDKFIPLGMKEFKNVADFLTEQKVPANKKKEQLILTNRNNLVWIIGLRIDERKKLNQNTKKAIELWLK